MFRKIGTDDKGKPVVLCEFNGAETSAMERILWAAQISLVDLRMSETDSIVTRMMIDALYKTFGIEKPE